MSRRGFLLNQILIPDYFIEHNSGCLPLEATDICPTYLHPSLRQFVIQKDRRMDRKIPSILL